MKIFRLKYPQRFLPVQLCKIGKIIDGFDLSNGRSVIISDRICRKGQQIFPITGRNDKLTAVRVSLCHICRFIHELYLRLCPVKLCRHTFYPRVLAADHAPDTLFVGHRDLKTALIRLLFSYIKYDLFLRKNEFRMLIFICSSD